MSNCCQQQQDCSSCCCRSTNFSRNQNSSLIGYRVAYLIPKEAFLAGCIKKSFLLPCSLKLCQCDRCKPEQSLPAQQQPSLNVSLERSQCTKNDPPEPCPSTPCSPAPEPSPEPCPCTPRSPAPEPPPEPCPCTPCSSAPAQQPSLNTSLERSQCTKNDLPEPRPCTPCSPAPEPPPEPYPCTPRSPAPEPCPCTPCSPAPEPPPDSCKSPLKVCLCDHPKPLQKPPEPSPLPPSPTCLSPPCSCKFPLKLYSCENCRLKEPPKQRGFLPPDSCQSPLKVCICDRPEPLQKPNSGKLCNCEKCRLKNKPPKELCCSPPEPAPLPPRSSCPNLLSPPEPKTCKTPLKLCLCDPKPSSGNSCNCEKCRPKREPPQDLNVLLPPIPAPQPLCQPCLNPPPPPPEPCLVQQPEACKDKVNPLELSSWKLCCCDKCGSKAVPPQELSCLQPPEPAPLLSPSPCACVPEPCPPKPCCCKPSPELCQFVCNNTPSPEPNRPRCVHGANSCCDLCCKGIIDGSGVCCNKCFRDMTEKSTSGVVKKSSDKSKSKQKKKEI